MISRLTVSAIALRERQPQAWRDEYLRRSPPFRATRPSTSSRSDSAMSPRMRLAAAQMSSERSLRTHGVLQVLGDRLLDPRRHAAQGFPFPA